MAFNPLIIFAQNIIRKNQNNLPNTPWAQAAVNAIMTGDSKAGEQIANNLCESYGVTKEQAINQAKQSFNINS